MTTTIATIREKHDGTLSRSTGIRLWLRLLSCSTVIEKRLRRRLIERFDTTLPRFDVLAALDRHSEGMTLSALSRSLLVSGGNVTSIVQALVRDGYVDVTTAREDRRASIATLTPSGQTHFDALSAAHHGWIEAMLAEVTPDQRQLLFELLGAVKLSIAHADPGAA